MHSMGRSSTTSHDLSRGRSRARSGALGCWLLALIGCDEGHVASAGDEQTESASGPLDAGGDDTTDSDGDAGAELDSTGDTADAPGTGASDGDRTPDAPHGDDYRMPEAAGGGCEACWSCLLQCDLAKQSCVSDADYWRGVSERDCWYAYGWVCWYVEPGNDQDGACINYNSCMISADLQYQWDASYCGVTNGMCRDQSCWDICLCKEA